MLLKFMVLFVETVVFCYILNFVFRVRFFSPRILGFKIIEQHMDVVSLKYQKE